MSGANCAGCGACCAVISMQGSLDNFRFILKRADPNDRRPESVEKLANFRFMVEHFHPVDIETAARVNPMRVQQNTLNNFYVCDWWDPQSGLCTAHEARPPMCRQAPWYGRPADQAWPLLLAWPQCSYWNDVPKELWPAGIEPLASPPADGKPVNVC